MSALNNQVVKLKSQHLGLINKKIGGIEFSIPAECEKSDLLDKNGLTKFFNEMTSRLSEDTDDYNEISGDMKEFSDGTYYSIVNYKCIDYGVENETLVCVFLTLITCIWSCLCSRQRLLQSFRDTFGEIIDSIVITLVRYLIK